MPDPTPTGLSLGIDQESTIATDAVPALVGLGGVLRTGPVSYIISNETWTYNCFLYKENGTYISSPYNIGPNSSFKIISWNASTSEETKIEFQLRSAKSELELVSKPFVGIDGTPSSYYNKSGSDIWSGHQGDYWVQYMAYLKTANVMKTPTLKNVTIVYNLWPNTTLIYPPNDCILSNIKPNFTWNFTDFDSSNQTAFQIKISDNITFETIEFDSNIQNSKNFTWQFPLGTSYKNLPDGTWYWKARTKDNDGDWGLYSPPWKLIIDTKPPNSTIFTPKNLLSHLEA